MKCIDCHFLCDTEGNVLPERKREQLSLRISNSFQVLCAKAMEYFAQEEPVVFDLVLKERRCRGFAPVRYSMSVEKMLQLQLRESPVWLNLLMAVCILITIASIIYIIMQFV